MGIIYRNGIPYGGADSHDVSVVADYAALEALTVKTTNHLYITEDTNTSYYYDETQDTFIPVGGGSEEITASTNAILVGNGSGWAKQNNSTIFITKRVDANSGSVASIYSSEDNMELKTIDGSNNPVNLLKLFDGSTIDASGGAVFEMNGQSELRLHNGATITAETISGVTTITFGGTQVEGQVSFTIAELKALKALLAQPKLAQMTQQEYEQLDPPDPDTVYVLNSGGN